MSFIVDAQVETYAEAHSTPMGELFERLAAETREMTTAPQMMVGQLEGRFLGVLVRTLGARRVLELGTFTGYSSISMALALPSEGRVITCDVDEETTAIAERYAQEAGVIDRIDYRPGSLRFQTGFLDYLGAAAVRPGLELLAEVGLSQVEGHVEGLVPGTGPGWSGRGGPRRALSGKRRHQGPVGEAGPWVFKTS